MKVLHIVETAYRATLEEQDDPVLWLVHVLRNAGADVAILLQGSAVSYAVRTQDATGLAFGNWRQTRPPSITTALAALIRDGVTIYAIGEDLADRGIHESRRTAAVLPLPRSQVPELFDRFDQVWQW